MLFDPPGTSPSPTEPKRRSLGARTGQFVSRHEQVLADVKKYASEVVEAARRVDTHQSVIKHINPRTSVWHITATPRGGFGGTGGELTPGDRLVHLLT